MNARPGRRSARTRPPRSAMKRSPIPSSSAAARAASRSARGCASSACRPSSSTSNDRPGDQWRKRYKSLCLHDPVWYDHLPYIPFPKNWPVFAPKDKIGDWLEMYTKVMELNYWTRHHREEGQLRRGRRRNGPSSSNRDGEEVTLRPKQLVLATGMSGKANMPKFKGRTSSRASSSIPRQHPGPDAYAARRWWSSARTTRRTTSAPRCGRRRRRHHGAALDDAYRASDTLMDIGLGGLYSRAGAGERHDDRKGRPDLRLAALPDHARIPDPALRPDARARRRLLRRAGGPASSSTGATTARACS
jgi:hypothetical protein